MIIAFEPVVKDPIHNEGETRGATKWKETSIS